MTERIPLDAMTSDQLDALYAKAETSSAWYRKAIHYALAIPRLASTIEGIEVLANREITTQGPWSDGYRAALADLREAIDTFQPRKDIPTAFRDWSRQIAAPADPATEPLNVKLHSALRPVTLCESGRHLAHTEDTCDYVDATQRAMKAALLNLDDWPPIDEDIAADRNHDVRQEGE